MGIYKLTTMSHQVSFLMLLSLMVMVVVVKTNTDHCDGLLVKTGGNWHCVPREKTEASDGPMVHKKKRELEHRNNNFKACLAHCYGNADCIENCYGPIHGN